MEKELKEKISTNPFDNFKENSIDDSTRTLRKVCLFGNPKSKNGYTYSSKAIDDLLGFSGQAKMYINHISKEERRNYGGARDIKNFGGVFSHPRRIGNKIIANLRCRRSVYPLLKDLARMAVPGIGFSLDAKALVRQDDAGDVIESVVKLREFSLVSEAATCEGLYEAIQGEYISDLAEFINDVKGGKVDRDALEEFLNDCQERDNKDIIYMPRTQEIYKQKLTGKTLHKEEIAEALEKYFNIDVSDVRPKGKGSIQNLDDFIRACR